MTSAATILGKSSLAVIEGTSDVDFVELEYVGISLYIPINDLKLSLINPLNITF